MVVNFLRLTIRPMMSRSIVFFVILIILHIVHSQEQFIQTGSRIQSSSSLCSIHRQGFGQLEYVELTASSINIQFTNIFSNLQCSTIHVSATITNTLTNEIEQKFEDIQTNNFYTDRLLSNHDYSVIIKVSDEKSLRILPTYIFQTLELSNRKTVTLSNDDLLTVEQIESFIFPHTHMYIVTLPSHVRRTAILGNITLSYTIDQKQNKYHHIVKPLDNNVISRIGRIASKTIAFSIELPNENNTSIEYSTSIQLFYSNDRRQSIIDHPVMIKYPQPITVDFLTLSTRSMRVFINHLCLSYIEVKAIVYNDLKAVSRGQCDINKKDTSLSDITKGKCSIVFDKLQPEENYTLSVRATCPITTSSSLSFVFHDQARLYPFQTSSGLPDDSPLVLSFYNNNRTLTWTDPSTNMSYLGPDYYYELFTKSNDNWTLIYRGNNTQYQLKQTLLEQTNLTFRLYVGNQYGRQETHYSQLDVRVDPIYHSTSNNQIVIITILISILFLILFGFIFFACYLRSKKLYGKLKKKYGQNGDISDKELDHLRSLTFGNTLKDNVLYTWNHTPTSVDIKKLPKIERAMIKLDRLIGKGAFGEVYAGLMTNNQSVAIKTLHSSASSAQRVDFLKEAIIMNQFNHEHIIHLLGVCFHNDYQPQFLVIELMKQGDLQNYLRRSRPSKDNDQCQLSYDDCLDIARQIADGACYLEQHSYVHRDLAARNCLVSSKDINDGKVLVKIGDFGLARMLSQQDYYRKTGEALLPVRWMAPESLLDAIFTSNSDIWSFGIVLWEIITLGHVPYSPMSNQQVISLITTTRGTLEKPIQCTQALFELMLSCWQYIPEDRINFSDLHSHLNEIIMDENKEQPSIWFSNEASSTTARNVLDCVLSHIEPPTSISFEGSDNGECRSSTSGCFSSMTESTSPSNQHNHHHHHHHHHPKEMIPSYQLRLIDDTTSNDFADDDDHSDIVRSF
ncbi:unnamed protein product [Rotaria socialis]|uniref:receptor protein-tyrosine kinase n=2 Tax=Rotaria socialis TaxID=392032 RepID=A0A818SQ49_9BILA|nr:unnamed protein product [Rotaria socialis]